VGKGQKAVTQYAVVKSDEQTSVLRVKLHTGRKHQIRAHLCARGWPIVGDAVYGNGEKGGLKLMAVKLAFDHPRTGKRMVFELSPAWE
jgi:23S rRNA pseudouridine1911/1915/1917 synthase